MSIKRSKLHRRLKKTLGLSKLGFKSEKWIGPYRADEISYEKRVIIEINGDAVHGNPRIFGPSDILPYGITADEKWDQDAKKLTFFEEHGWHVIVVWESDDMKVKKKLIETVMGWQK